MKINLKIEGGFAPIANMAKPISIDSEQLSSPDAQRLNRLVQAAHFFDLPKTFGNAHPNAADYEEYILRIHDGKRTHTVKTSEFVDNAALLELIDYLKTYFRSRVTANWNGTSTD